MTNDEFGVWVPRKAARMIRDLDSVGQAVDYLERAADWVDVEYIAEATETLANRVGQETP